MLNSWDITIITSNIPPEVVRKPNKETINLISFILSSDYFNEFVESFLAETIDSDVCTRKQAKLKKDIQDLESRIIKLDKSPKVTLEQLETFKDECLSLGEAYVNGDSLVRKDLLKSALWNVTVLNGEIASIQYKLPYKYISEASKSGQISKWLAAWELVMANSKRS